MVAFGIVGVNYLSKPFLEIRHPQSLWDLAGIFDTNPKQSRDVANTHRTIAYKEPEGLFRFSEAILLGEDSENSFSLAKEALTNFQHLLICAPSRFSEDEMNTLLKISEESQVLVRFGGSITHHPVSKALLTQVHLPFFVELHHAVGENRPALFKSELINVISTDLALLLSITEGMVCKAETSVLGNSPESGVLECRLKIDNGSEIRMVYSFCDSSQQRVISVQQPGAQVVADFRAGTVTSARGTVSVPYTESECALRQLEAFARDIENQESELIDRDILMFYLAHALIKKAKPWLSVNYQIQS